MSAGLVIFLVFMAIIVIGNIAKAADEAEARRDTRHQELLDALRHPNGWPEDSWQGPAPRPQAPPPQPIKHTSRWFWQRP